MRIVFADTVYWIAVSNPKDQFHQAAKRTRHALGAVRLVTTDEILIELLDAFAMSGPLVRQQIASVVREILADPEVDVLPGSRQSFLEGLELYERRLDKRYTVTDCMSMAAMKDAGIRSVLTTDHHFRQEGFSVLISDSH